MSLKVECTKNPEHKFFQATAHVTQAWKCDENGEFVEELNPCIDITHKPDAEDYWTCLECGAEAMARNI